MSSASINDQVRRTVLHHCFQSVRSGTSDQLALWDAVLDHFNIQAPKKEEMVPQQQQGDGVAVASPTTTVTTTAATTPSRDQMQRLGRKLSQLASKMYGLSVDALNNHEMFFVCVILDLKEFVAPAPSVPAVAALQPPTAVISSSPPSLYMDDDIASTPPPPPPHTASSSTISEVIEVVETPPTSSSAALAVVAVPAAAAAADVIKTPSKRAMQVILENFHYSKNPLPQRVRRAPEVLVYDPPLKAAGKKAVPKKSAAAVSQPAAVAPVLGTKRDRPVVEKKKLSKLPTTTITELASGVAPGTSSRTNKTSGSTTAATSTTVMPVNTNSAALMMSNLMDSSSSYCSTSDDDGDADSEGVTENEVMSGGLTVNRQDVFDFKQKKGISALAEDVDYGDDDLDDDEDTPEGRRRRKQLKLVEVLRLEGMLTVEIALKVLNSGTGKKGGGKKAAAAAAAAGGDPPATAADVALHFDDIIRRGFAVKDFDDTIFLCS